MVESTEGNSIESNYIECNSVEASNVYSNDEQQFRLNKINKIKDYFIAEIKEAELMSQTLRK